MKRKPKYCLHKTSGHARVYIGGVEHFLGLYGSQGSLQRYEELTSDKVNRSVIAQILTIDELVLLYLSYAEHYYTKDGRPTGETANIRSAFRPVVRLFGPILACNFSPKKLTAVRDEMIGRQICRKSINRHISRIKGMFKWAVAEEHIHAEVLVGLQAVAGLKKYRSAARESEDVTPVAIEQVHAIEPFVRPAVWAMVRLQLLTGMRPGEARIMRGHDLNIAGPVWEYVPVTHKTEHHGKARMVMIGPRGQSIVQTFLRSELDAYLFSADGRSQGLGRPYTKQSYPKAIERACRQAGVSHWLPNQLRHNAATELRREFGIEAARTVLGHASAVTSEIYAEMDMGKARDIIAHVG